jgi:putative protein-disulfide isomerase
MNKLIYISDPLCGWCYGNSKNILEIKRQFASQFDFEILMGGMWLPPNTKSGGDNLSKFMQEHVPPMEKTTGAKVSEAFYQLANNPNYVFSSLEASAASVLVKKLKPEVAFEFASAVQTRFYQEGAPLDQTATYLPILQKLGIDSDQFKTQWLQDDNLRMTKAEFTRAGTLANGFPTLLIEMNGEMGKITAGYFDLEAMSNHLKKLV